MARTITPMYTCAVCGKTTTRLLGFIAVLKLSGDGEGGGQASRHAAVLGTCAAHRDRIPEQFAAQAAVRGEVISVSDEPVALRPAQVPDWYVEVERAAAEALASVGYPIDNTFIPVSSPDELPSTCPHCGGELSWGTGPHVADAAARGDASAWECLDCRAAGLLQPTDRPAH
ncbi:hypothetical protein [Nocardia sp. NPDC005745]|uniref:hypothetical protein n=1 Tax=Nocardia sp. NPDC005745 TaxID=3157061 RepID=UPI0033F9E360